MIFKLDETTTVELDDTTCAKIQKLMDKHLEYKEYHKGTDFENVEAPWLCKAAKLVVEHCPLITLVGENKILDYFR